MYQGVYAELRAAHNAYRRLVKEGTRITSLVKGLLDTHGYRPDDRTPMSKQGSLVLRYCAWTAVIPMLRFNSDFRAWAKKIRERPVHANPLNGREVVGAGLNRLLRLSFALVKKQTFYRVPEPARTTW